MLEFVCNKPDSIKVDIKREIVGEFTKLDITFTAEGFVSCAYGDIFIGFKGECSRFKGVILTHDVPVASARLPFAFPAVIANADSQSISIVCDYYKTHAGLRNVIKQADKGIADVGILCQKMQLKEGDTLKLILYYFIGKELSLFNLIGKSADIVISKFGYIEHEFNKPLSKNVKSYEEGVLGLTSNLLDKRSIINDGVGTFNPYAYHEIGAYSESFAAMDVAKGLYRYALIKKASIPLEFIKKELYKFVKTDGEYKWIDDVHNTTGFFHFVWGAVPQDSGVNPDEITRIGLFSDFCGHEEGENLLSTFKYFDRVMLFGEMALLEDDAKLKEGFFKMLPFFTSLHMDAYEQPVTYDLDTHEPKTGVENGGSGGGAALFALTCMIAYKMSNKTEYLEIAEKSVEALNKLDYDRMFSMRIAPKPIAVGAAVKANTILYEITGNQDYLNKALEFADGLFAHYYLEPHPFTFFSTVGFAYACARERWEAFREMIETLWFALPIVKYTKNKNLLKLYSVVKRNILWALPINGNPLGNIERDYESFGGEYVPFEFPTGHIGDNPGLEGGCQSSQRQIKEIYGCGELYNAYLIYEGFAKSSNSHVTILNTDHFYKIPSGNYSFRVFNASIKTESAVISFNNIEKGNYSFNFNGKMIAVYSYEQLTNGLLLNFAGDEDCFIAINLVNEQVIENNTCGRLTFRAEACVDLVNVSIDNDCDYYKIIINNGLNIKECLTTEKTKTLKICSELENKVTVCGFNKNGSVICKSDVIIIKALKKKLSFSSAYDQKDLTLKGFSVVSDGYCYMFYRGNNLSNEGEINIAMSGNIGDYLQFDLSSLNSGTKYSVELVYDEPSILACDSEKIGLYQIKLKKGGGFTLKIKARSELGLGLSISNLVVFSCEGSDNSALLKVNKGVGEYVASLLPEYKYVEIAVGMVEQGKGFDIQVDDESIYTEQERRYFYKVNRNNAGMFKFTLKEGSKEIKVITDSQNKCLVKAIRLTNESNYPVFTDYYTIEDFKE